ncbi:hypothetical protein [Prosthecobacter sp.]|jgi:hypothetical protein|uniref:hypothetical protein n=1 Tax=Prosthecobacter sp. TaxID=1965333 RepID=UPI0037C683DA
MSHQTVLLSSFEEYLTNGGDSPEEQDERKLERQERLVRFPYSVMLQVSFPELDFANRWCWRRFGPSYGECMQRYSEYRVCNLSEPHSHLGVWTCEWFVKTDYDFGFNEWYFAEEYNRESFLGSVNDINWGENFPKP